MREGIMHLGSREALVQPPLKSIKDPKFFPIWYLVSSPVGSLFIIGSWCLYKFHLFCINIEMSTDSARLRSLGRKKQAVRRGGLIVEKPKREAQWWVWPQGCKQAGVLMWKWSTNQWVNTEYQWGVQSSDTNCSLHPRTKAH